jgi:hypothetical protein
MAQEQPFAFVAELDGQFWGACGATVSDDELAGWLRSLGNSRLIVRPVMNKDEYTRLLTELT